MSQNSLNLSHESGRKQETKHTKSIVYLALITSILLPEVALAANNPWDNVLQLIIDTVNSGTARLLAILVIIGLGLSAWFGKLSMTRVGGSIAGIVLVFGAAYIADFFIAGV